MASSGPASAVPDRAERIRALLGGDAIAASAATEFCEALDSTPEASLSAAPAGSPGPAACDSLLARLQAIRHSRHSVFVDSALGPDPPVYLDNNASTPIDPKVAAAMMGAGLGLPCNPSSSHAYGRRARVAVASARASLATLLGAPSADCVTFVSCGTEASNWAIRGSVAAWRAASSAAAGAPHIVSLTIEHPATLETCAWLQARATATAGAEGATVTAVPVNKQCVCSPEEVVAAVTERTCLVSVMLANNETGSMQPVRDIARLLDARAAELGLVGPDGLRRVALHVDASQAVGKIPVSVAELGCDYLTVAGHKMYAPPGCGALVVSPTAPWGVPPPLVLGAPQEDGRRAGTVSVAMAVALGTAAKLSAAFLAAGGTALLWDRRQQLAGALAAECSRLATEPPVPNGPSDEGAVLPNTLSVSFKGVSAAELLGRLDTVLAASLGSACLTLGASAKPSGVAAAMGLEPCMAAGTVRLSVGKHTSEDEIAFASAVIAETVADMRAGRAAVADERAAAALESAVAGSASGAAAAADSAPSAATPLGTGRLYFESTDLLVAVARVVASAAVSPASEDEEAPTAVLNGEEVQLKGAAAAGAAVIVLDETPAHPQGGGQPADRGFLVCRLPSGSLVRYPLVHVTKGPGSSEALGGAILHVVGEPEALEGDEELSAGHSLPSAGGACLVRVDPVWRAAAAKLHSAGHLLDAAVRKFAPQLRPTVGYHFPDRPSVSYAGRVPAAEAGELIDNLQAEVDRLVAEATPTSVSIFTAGDSEAACEAGLTAEEADDFIPGSTVRVVAVGPKSNVCPCGGTHVGHAGELSGLTIKSIKGKKGTTKVAYDIEGIVLA